MHEFQLVPSKTLDDQEITKLVELISLCFKDGPFMTCLYPNQPNERLEITTLIHFVRVKLFLLDSHVLVHSPSNTIVAHAALVPPSTLSNNGIDSQFNLFKNVFNHHPKALERMLVMMSNFSAHTKKIVGFPHWTLEAVVTHPDFRKRGVSTYLMNQLVEKLIKPGDIVALYTQVESNYHFYEKIGFKLQDKAMIECLDHESMPNWIMTREF